MLNRIQISFSFWTTSIPLHSLDFTGLHFGSSYLKLQLCSLHFIRIVQGLHLIDCCLPTGSLISLIQLRLSRQNVNNRLSGARLHPLFPVDPVSLIFDQEPNQHARIHILEVDASQAASVIASPFLGGVWLVGLVMWKRGARGVGIKEEQVGVLKPHEVVRCGGPSTYIGHG